MAHRNRPASKNRRLKKHMQKTLGFETFSQRIKRKLKSKPKCDVCGDQFNETDLKLKDSRPSNICVACFTSNA